MPAERVSGSAPKVPAKMMKRTAAAMHKQLKTLSRTAPKYAVSKQLATAKRAK